MNSSSGIKGKKSTWDVPASDMARNTFNPIRDIVDSMRIQPNPEKELIALSIGDPTVFGNLKPSENIVDAVVHAVKTGTANGYGPSVGYVEAREAVARAYSDANAPVEAKDVILTSGCSGAIELVISVLANPGQNCLIPRPGFSIYETIALSLGVGVRRYNLLPDKDWEADVSHMESLIDDNTAFIIVNDPSNPCGSVYSKEHLQDILAVAERNKLPIMSDEIYADFVFPGEKYYNLASLTTEVPILACGGLTKRYLCPGWRTGWIIVHDRNNVFDKEVRDGLLRLSQRILGPNTLVQAAMKNILEETPQHFFDKTIEVVKNNAHHCYNRIKDIPGLTPVMPRGAMYMMIGIDIDRFPDFKDDLDFTRQLISEQSVLCLPGQCFKYPNFFRVVLTLPQNRTEDACDRIAEYCKQHYITENGKVSD
ncbi:tyrosine aminotransferase-like [Ptychodera flava]|uniref:tyrosine aminotransferase-like n=1 Tax=Ptychodera flava TaxID=63121 RepID=UPI00396AAF69